jgi:hypothetical protein
MTHLQKITYSLVLLKLPQATDPIRIPVYFNMSINISILSSDIGQLYGFFPIKISVKTPYFAFKKYYNAQSCSQSADNYHR